MWQAVFPDPDQFNKYDHRKTAAVEKESVPHETEDMPLWFEKDK